MQSQLDRQPDRPMRVLHISNIANNAYVASTILNKHGIESHVLVADYYHTLGCPEWESAEIKGDWGNDFFPAWHKVDLAGFKRPRWFAQGPRYSAIRYLIAINERRRLSAWVNWCFMAFYRRLVTLSLAHKIFWRIWHSRPGLLFRKLTHFDHPGPAPGHRKPPFPGAEYARAPKPSEILSSVIRPMSSRAREKEVKRLMELMRDKHENAVAKAKAQNLPSPEPLAPNVDSWIETHQFDADSHLWKRLFSYYDIVVGFSTDGVYPLSVGKPYIAFEHGTIRELPFEDNYLGRQTAAVYQNANAVLITNCDNNRAADKLGIKNYHFIPHPTTETEID